MSTYLDLDKVQVQCSCAKMNPLCRLYFCRHCLKLRCCNCVSHEVDSFYCPNCLENMPSTEAKLRKHRCANCLDCPSCGHSLSTRATVGLVSSTDDPSKIVSQKAYYMTCGYCRWTTRDAGIKDQRSATGGWPEKENPNQKQISALIESFRQLAVKEKVDKERRKYARRKSYFMLSDRYQSLTPYRRQSSAYIAGLSARANESEQIQVNIPAAEPYDESEDFDLSAYIDQPFSIEKVTTIGQRLMSPETQPVETGQLEPHHKHLLVKRSMRCRQCDHNLSKAEYNPSTIKFKINLGAVYHVPEVRIRPGPAGLAFNKTSDVILTLINPAHRITTVKLLPVSGEPDTYSTAKLSLPECSVKLAPFSDTGGYDETPGDFQDDPKTIAYRNVNTVGVLVRVAPMKSSGEVLASLLLNFDYKNTSAALPSELAAREQQTDLSSVTVRIFLNFGQLPGASN